MPLVPFSIHEIRLFLILENLTYSPKGERFVSRLLLWFDAWLGVGTTRPLYQKEFVIR